ncbi:MAG: hypothetical protein WBE74_08915 [Terracidiphilus sp.]
MKLGESHYQSFARVIATEQATDLRIGNCIVDIGNETEGPVTPQERGLFEALDAKNSGEGLLVRQKIGRTVIRGALHGAGQFVPICSRIERTEHLF